MMSHHLLLSVHAAYSQAAAVKYLSHSVLLLQLLSLIRFFNRYYGCNGVQQKRGDRSIRLINNTAAADIA